GEIGLVPADDGQVPFLADLEHLVVGPLAVLPRPDPAGELAEIDLRVEIGGEVAAVASGIDVDDVDRVDAVETGIMRIFGVGVDDAGVEAGAEDGGDAGAGAFLAPLPF